MGQLSTPKQTKDSHYKWPSEEGAGFTTYLNQRMSAVSKLSPKVGRICVYFGTNTGILQDGLAVQQSKMQVILARGLSAARFFGRAVLSMTGFPDVL